MKLDVEDAEEVKSNQAVGEDFDNTAEDNYADLLKPLIEEKPIDILKHNDANKRTLSALYDGLSQQGVNVDELK